MQPKTKKENAHADHDQPNVTKADLKQVHRQRDMVEACACPRNSVYRRGEARRRCGGRLLASRRNRACAALRPQSGGAGVSALDAEGEARPDGAGSRAKTATAARSIRSAFPTRTFRSTKSASMFATRPSCCRANIDRAAARRATGAAGSVLDHKELRRIGEIRRKISDYGARGAPIRSTTERSPRNTKPALMAGRCPRQAGENRSLSNFDLLPKFSRCKPFSGNGEALPNPCLASGGLTFSPNGETMSLEHPNISSQGSRRLTLTMLAAREQADQFEGLPRGMGKPFRFLAAFQQAAPYLGLPPTPSAWVSFLVQIDAGTGLGRRLAAYRVAVRRAAGRVSRPLSTPC